MSRPSLEKDIRQNERIRLRVCEDDSFAHELYAALCNTKWTKDGAELPVVIPARKSIWDGSDLPEIKEYYHWAGTWRFSGELVAELQGATGEWDYCKYYCSGNEGKISENVAIELKRIGWTGRPYDE